MATDATETKRDLNLEVTQSKGPGKKETQISCEQQRGCVRVFQRRLKETVRVHTCPAPVALRNACVQWVWCAVSLLLPPLFDRHELSKRSGCFQGEDEEQ